MSPYNTSTKVVRRLERYLQDMDEARRSVEWATSDPDRLAYRIREALAAAREHEDEFPSYAELQHLFQIQSREGKVRARYIGIDQIEDQEPGSTSASPTPSGPERMTVDHELVSATGVVGAALKFKNSSEELFFPNARLSTDELTAVWRWTQGNDWKLIEHEGKGLTLTKGEVSEALLWTPEEGEDG